MDELQLRMIALQSATRAVAAREEKENMAKSMNNQTVMDVVGEEKENQQEQMDANSKDTGMQVFFFRVWLHTNYQVKGGYKRCF